MDRAVFAIVGCLLLANSGASTQGPLKISVLLGVAQQEPSPEGFVDAIDVKGLNDSARDIAKALDGKDFHPNKGFPGSPEHYVLTTDPAKADLTLTVAARGTSAQTLGSRTTMQIYRGVVVADTVPTVGVTRWVSIILSVGTYRKEFVTWYTNQSRWSAGAWTDDANLLAKIVAGWVMQNEARIVELQKARGGGFRR